MKLPGLFLLFIKRFLTMASVLILILLNTTSVYAVCADNPNNIVPAPGGLPTLGCDSGNTKVSLILKIIFGALTMLSLLFIVIGGLKYTLSGGDSNAIKSAKNTILYAVVGLVLGLLVFSIFSFIFSRLGN